MTKLLKRGRSLNNSNKNDKRNWLLHILEGFGNSQRFKKQDKTEKSSYSQTENFHSRGRNETGTQYSDYNLKPKSTYSESSETLTGVVSQTLLAASNVKGYEKSCKLHHKNPNMTRKLTHDVLQYSPDIDKALNTVIEDIFNEGCYENIKNDAKSIQSFMILQRMKFKHELSKLYHQIYTKNDADPNSYTFYQEIFAGYGSSNENLHKNLKTKWQRQHFKSAVASNEREIKELCCTVRQNTTKRYTIKKSEIVKKENRKLNDVEEDVTDSEVEYDNDVISNMKPDLIMGRKITEDSNTVLCAVSISPLNTPPSVSRHLHGRHRNGEVRQMRTRKDSKQGNGDSNVCAHKVVVDKNESAAVDRRPLTQTMEKTGVIDINTDSKKVYLRDSSIILDIEVPGEGQRKSVNFYHSFSDMKTLSSQDYDCQSKDETLSVTDLVSARLVNVDSTVSCCTIGSNSNTQRDLNLKSSRSQTESESTISDSNRSGGYIEKIDSREKLESRKFSQVDNNCVSLSEALSYPFGTLCEVLSEDFSNDTNVSFRQRNHCQLNESNKTTLILKSGPTFLKHTISSRLKMKHEG